MKEFVLKIFQNGWFPWNKCVQLGLVCGNVVWVNWGNGIWPVTQSDWVPLSQTLWCELFQIKCIRKSDERPSGNWFPPEVIFPLNVLPSWFPHHNKWQLDLSSCSSQGHAVIIKCLSSPPNPCLIKQQIMWVWVLPRIQLLLTILIGPPWATLSLPWPEVIGICFCLVPPLTLYNSILSSYNGRDLFQC